MPYSASHSHHDMPLIRVPGLGLELRVRLSPEVCGGALTVIDTINQPGFGPPLHRHAETEVFRVLTGRYLFEIEGRRFFAEAGDVVSVRGGAAHAFLNVGDQPASQMVMVLPGLDATAFFTGLGAVTQGGPPDLAALNRFGAAWGVEFLGPPLSRS